MYLKMVNSNTLLITLSFLLLVTILFLVFNGKSTFDGAYSTTYSNSGCEQNDRQYPEGNIPGSYLGLNKYEQEGLLKNFIMNNPNLN
jgi:hypothetical protein